jgi:hypothetical protein
MQPINVRIHGLTKFCTYFVDIISNNTLYNNIDQLKKMAYLRTRE